MSTKRGICGYIVMNEIFVLLINAVSISQANPTKMTAEFCKNALIPNAGTPVYINADLTPTQAKLEYEKRKRRREARNNKNATSAAQAVSVIQTTSSDITACHGLYGSTSCCKSE